MDLRAELDGDPKAASFWYTAPCAIAPAADLPSQTLPPTPPAPLVPGVAPAAAEAVAADALATRPRVPAPQRRLSASAPSTPAVLLSSVVTSEASLGATLEATTPVCLRSMAALPPPVTAGCCKPLALGCASAPEAVDIAGCADLPDQPSP